MMWAFIAVFVLLTGRAHSMGDVAHLVCEENHVVSRIESSLSLNDSDRQWEIECKEFVTEDCAWSSFHSLHEQDLSFKCPANQVVAGFFSDSMKKRGSRRWNIYCCSAPDLTTFDCQETPMLNEDFNWNIPEDSFLTGIHAKNSKNDEGDHRWSFTHCRGTTGDSQSINSKILAVNKPIAGRFIQGDVVIKRGRNARVCDNCKWPKTRGRVKVPYTLENTFTTFEKDTILQAMKVFHQSTCIRFVRRRRQTDFVEIIKSSGCWSYVGRIGETQQLSIGEGCAYNGIVQHELIHALGFWHEQSRSDRDFYVRINYENIIEQYIHNFNIQNSNNLNVQYDYSSVMHYGPTDFSKNGEDTITPLSPSAQIGQRFGMTEDDILKINKLYGCTDNLRKNEDWDNKFHRRLHRKCPPGQVVSSFASFYNKKKKDRLWRISCQAFNSSEECHWSPFVNNYQENIDFNCPDNELIAGVSSTHSKRKADRRWKFYCCSFSDFTTANCTTSAVVNTGGEYLSLSVPSSNFLTGVNSSYDMETRDRQWSFSYCQGSTDNVP
ncbi:zinc metalloproteinase nas-33-like [Chelmon rostratus]|uniref:zinc metalloproteinase nas-33-like n=1 Tax=Chelmon rostratus TaxID=109905 RepID=UPI001BE6843E|nr:zinc metalloproteinase nas-33-like [Chelmon rostratus]